VAASELELNGDGRAGDDGARAEPEQSGPDAERPRPSAEAESEQPGLEAERPGPKAEQPGRRRSDRRQSGRGGGCSGTDTGYRASVGVGYF
jgi:hypothetical protein